jgi:rhomboid protease GluP
MFAMQHSLNDLWSRYPPLLDEDLHGELAPDAARSIAIARRPELHEQRLRRVAQELEQPDIVPWVTIGFASLCVMVFVFQLWSHGPFPDTTDIERVGGLQSDLDGMWWRFWMSNVLHAGVEHLTGNLLAWAFVATMIERVVGHARTAALIVVGAAGSSLGVLVADLDEPSLGASGVVFAGFAMAALLDPIAKRSIGKLGWSLVLLGLGLSTFAPGISSAGHVGGVMAGFVVGAVVMLLWRVQRPMRTAADRAALRRAPIDRSAPLASRRELTIAERLAHLDRRRDDGSIDPIEHARLRRALVTRG